MFVLWMLVPVVAVLLLWFVNYWSYNRHLTSIPAPKTWPLIGNALEIKSTKDTLDVILKLMKKFNSKMVRITVGFRTGIMIMDYKFLEYILSSQKILTKSRGYRFIEPWLGKGLLTSDGKKWKSHRKIITPTFHFQILEQFIDVFNSSGNLLIEKLRGEVNKGSTDIYNFITLCTLDIICETAMGTSVNAQIEAENSLYVKSVRDMCRIIQERTFNPLLHTDFLYRFSKTYQTERKALKVLHEYTDSVIRKRREILVNKKDDLQQDEIGLKKRTAFLDQLLQITIDGEPLSNRDIREEVDTFMFAGHDTTASAISFTLFCLANNPDVQKKAYAEIKEIFQNDPTRPATYKDLQEMKYLEMVIKETLRLFPSVPLIGRITTEEIKFDDLTIPKGIVLNIFTYGMHRDPEYFPNPETFDPERFSVENNLGKSPYCFIPFSAGPRNCMGQKFAMLEIKCLVTKMLRNYVLEPVVPVHKVVILAETVLKSHNGILIQLKERT